MSFVQRAQGDFSIEVTGPFHCGPDHSSPKRFTYEVEIQYPSTALDENGFLLDNLSFSEFFNGLGSTEISCERLAKYAAESLHARTAGRALSTSVGIWAIPNHAKIEYRVSA